MELDARIYYCVRCRKQTIICSHCDRGNVYCASTCSPIARVLNHRIANQKYQQTLKGRRKHAERQRRYRQRQKEKIKKVTDRGSSDLPPNDLLPPAPSETAFDRIEPACCHFCGEMVSHFLRIGYLRHHRNDKSVHFSSWPLGP